MKPTTGNSTPCHLVLEATRANRGAEVGQCFSQYCESFPLGRWEAARHLRVARQAGATIHTMKRGFRWIVRFPPGRLAVSGVLAIRSAA